MKIQIVASAVLTLVIAASAWSADAEQTGSGNGKGGPGGGAGNGQLREKIRQRILEKFDTNHNGKLDPDELAALKAAIQKWRENHPSQGRGQRFGGQQNNRQNPGATKASDNASTPRSSAKVDVRKAIEDDTRPGQVAF